MRRLLTKRNDGFTLMEAIIAACIGVSVVGSIAAIWAIIHFLHKYW